MHALPLGTTPLRSSSTAALALALLVSAASADVLVVDVDGGADFLQIDAAVAAASGGDTILVRSGSYARFTVSAVSLRIVADAGAEVSVDGAIGVSNLAAGQTVVISGIDGTGTEGVGAAFGSGFFGFQNQGRIRVQDCEFRGADGWDELAPAGYGFVHAQGWDGARIYQSADVVFDHCTFVGGTAITNVTVPGDCCTIGELGGAGLYADESSVVVYGSTSVGGTGGTADILGGRGGHALVADDSFAHVANTILTGGMGGDAEDFICPDAGDGGDAAHTLGASSIEIVDTALAGGAPGFAFVCGTFGDPGAESSGSVAPVLFGGEAPLMLLTPVAREGETVTIQIDAAPGSVGLLLASGVTTALALPQFAGVLLTDLPVLFGAGVAPSEPGVYTFQFAYPPLPPGVLAQSLHLQLGSLTTGLEVRLGNYRALSGLDASLPPE